MKKILVTGANGFIGKNLCASLGLRADVEILRLDKSSSEQELRDFTREAEFIFHLAGVNRPNDESDFKKVNTDLTESIIKYLREYKSRAPILITSSKQAELDNPYGKSKRAAEGLVFDWAKENGSGVFVYRLPNVFGKWCRPNYNSVVATFCHNIATYQPISINDPATELGLVYIDDVVRSFIGALQGEVRPESDNYCRIENVFKVTLKELSDKIYAFMDSRTSLRLPNLESDFDRYLYATFVSHLDPQSLGYKLLMRSDDRGWLAEFIKSNHMGQIFVSRTKPGITRGNHWHHTKIEKFLVVQGSAVIRFKHLDGGDIISYEVSGQELTVVDIPPGYSHNISNTGQDDLITIFWADEIFDPEKPDTNALEVK